MIPRRILPASVLVAAAFIAGCSSFDGNVAQKVVVKSTPDDATVVINGKTMTDTTDTEFVLNRDQDYVIEISKTGYKTASTRISHRSTGAENPGAPRFELDSTKVDLILDEDPAVVAARTEAENAAKAAEAAEAKDAAERAALEKEGRDAVAKEAAATAAAAGVAAKEAAGEVTSDKAVAAALAAANVFESKSAAAATDTKGVELAVTAAHTELATATDRVSGKEQGFFASLFAASPESAIASAEAAVDEANTRLSSAVASNAAAETAGKTAVAAVDTARKAVAADEAAGRTKDIEGLKTDLAKAVSVTSDAGLARSSSGSSNGTSTTDLITIASAIEALKTAKPAQVEEPVAKAEPAPVAKVEEAPKAEPAPVAVAPVPVAPVPVAEAAPAEVAVAKKTPAAPGSRTTDEVFARYKELRSLRKSGEINEEEFKQALSAIGR